MRLIRRFLVWLGYAPTWFTAEEFEARVGRAPCASCVADNRGSSPLILCAYDLDAWFDAVLA